MQSTVMNGSPFAVTIPLVKAAKGKDGSWWVHGVASDESLDLQGEVTLASGLKASLPYLRRFGKFNDDHKPVDVGEVVNADVLTKGELARRGILDGVPASESNEEALYVGGPLYKHVDRGRYYRDVLRSGGRLGLSVQGAVLEKDVEKSHVGRRVAALPENLASLALARQMASLAEQKYGEIAQTPGAGPGLVAEAWHGAVAARAGVEQGWLGMGTFSSSPELAERMEQGRFGQHVLQRVMGARGSIRGQVRQQMDTAQEMMAQLEEQSARTMPYVPERFRPAVEHQFNQQRRALGMEVVSAQQELQEGWLERVVGSVWNVGGNANLVMSEFNYSGAVRHGARARHLGSTSADLPFYREQAMDYFTYGGAGRFGTQRGFLASGLAGVTDDAASGRGFLPPARPGGVPGLPALATSSGTGAPGQVIELRIVIEDSHGNVLGSLQKSITNAFEEVYQRVDRGRTQN